MSFARDERIALCDLLEETGPGAPTLCEGWRTLDLAAHLVLREHRPDAAAGVMGGPLASHTGRVQRTLIARRPPRLSVFAIPGMDERLNMVEYFVHHEDVRRGADGWQSREISAGMADALWQRLRAARLVFRKAPVGIELVRDDRPPGPGHQQVRITAKARTPMVTVTGDPAALTLWALGRTTAARVRLDGSEPDVQKLTQTSWRA